MAKKKLGKTVTRAQPKKRKVQRKQMASMDLLSKKYAQLLVNPCSAELAYPPSMGASESGYLVRLYRRYVFHQTTANNTGLFMWMPGFHCSDEGGFNVYSWETSSPSTNPTNSASTPMGTGGTGGNALPDCAGGWVSSANVSSARTVAACARVYYTGNLSLASGSVGVIPNLTADQMVNGGGGQPMSVNQALTICPTVSRIPLEPREIRWAPATGDLTYKARARPAQADANAPISVGAVGATESQTTPVSNGTAGIGIAWSGLSTSSGNDLIIECIKIIEWMPDATGLSQPTNNPRPKSTYESILTYLDDNLGGWRDSITMSSAQTVISTAQAGIGLYGSYLGLGRAMGRLTLG